MEPWAYSREQVAQLLSISEGMVKKLIAAGDLRAIKVGARTLVTKQDLESYIQSLRGEV